MFIDDVIAALNANSWPAYVVEQLGPRIGDAVAPALRPVIGAAVESGEAVPVGGSKLGGLPHVDGSFVWPTEAGTSEPLALVCQLNLDSVGAPLRGMLYLFSIYDGDRAYGYEIDDTTAVIIHAPQPGPLALAARPAGLGDDGVFAERLLRLAPSLIAEEVNDEGAFVHARFDYEVESALDRALLASGGAPCDVVRLLGHAHLFRAETRELVDQSTQDLLLHVNGYVVDLSAFGEGEFHVVIDRTALASGHLHEAEILFEPGT